MYKKRAGTTGVRGQLYETKLLSLLQFRAQYDEKIEEFLLATNVDHIGAFDDICFRAKVKGFDKPIAVFIQAKHKENDCSFTLLNSKDLTKYFESYLKIRQAFEKSEKELLFDGVFEKVECLFVLYTTARDTGTEHAPVTPTIQFLNEIIGTGDPAYQTACNQNHMEFLYKMAVKEEIAALAAQVASHICGEGNYTTMLENKLIQRYHVLLARKVFHKSQVRSDGCRYLLINKDFFIQKDYRTDEYLLVFKDALYLEILKRQNIESSESMLHLKMFFREPIPIAEKTTILSYLIGNVVTFDKDKLKFVNSRMFSDEMKKQLSKVYVSEATVNEAIEKGATRVLDTRELKVPAEFGNHDLKIRGNETKINRRLDYLVSTLCHLIDQAKPEHIITIDESALGDGLLKLNGGLGSAVGNVLVHDTDTNLLKFAESSEELEANAKMLFERLSSKIENLNNYRFDVKAYTFPKLTFDCSEHDTTLVKDFLNKLVLFTNQADESGVEEALRNEIEDERRKGTVTSNLKVRSEAIYLKFHDAIQKWWLSPEECPYLTKQSGTYEGTISNIVKDPLISIMYMIYRNKTRNVDYTFKEDALTNLPLQDQNTTLVVSRSVTLTTAKIIQYFNSRQHAVIDLEHVSYLPPSDFVSLCTELTSNENLVILICDVAKYSRQWCKVLEKIASAVRDKQTIIVTNEDSKAFAKQYFSLAADINDKIYLGDMAQQTQVSILENASITFQDQQMTLNAIVDESMSFIHGEVLDKIVQRETIEIGKPVGNSSYDEIKNLYVNRRMSRGRIRPKRYRDLLMKDTDIYIETLNDVADDVVLVTAKPGMGKSTLLTHLSFNTKELDPNVWIVRINLLEYSREFNEWKEKKTVIDTLETMRFLCRVTLSEKRRDIRKLTISLEDTNGVIQLKDTNADEYTTFELKMFLHFYNSKRIIFLFDGFDEICPHYTKEVLNLLKNVRSFPAKHKMWVASRSYNIIKSILQKEFGTAYEIQPFSLEEKQEYLEKFWISNLVLNEFDSAQLTNTYEFINYITETEISIIVKSNPLNKVQFIPLYYIYFSALEYLQRTIMYTYIPKWSYHVGLKSQGMMLILLHCNGKDKDSNEMLKFTSTPLHLYLIADYFQNEIKDVNAANKWNIDLNMFSIYERFLETKLKRIRFQEKNKMDIYNPDIITTYEKELKEFIEKHKQLAAYAMFHRHNHSLFSRKQLKDIKKILKLIKKGGEKTGVIYSVKNNLPIFAHMTFAEYFAVEHVCDLLKNETCNSNLMDFIFDTVFIRSPANILNILDSKLALDEDLSKIFKANDKVVFDILIEQSKGYLYQEFDPYSDYMCEVKKFDSSFNRAVYENLSNFIEFFCSIHDKYLTVDNLDTFIEMVFETRMATSALTVKCDEFLRFAINVVRKIDEKRIGGLFNHEYWISIFIKYDEMSTEEIIQMHRNHMHMGISRFYCPPNQFDHP